MKAVRYDSVSNNWVAMFKSSPILNLNYFLHYYLLENTLYSNYHTHRQVANTLGPSAISVKVLYA